MIVSDYLGIPGGIVSHPLVPLAVFVQPELGARIDVESKDKLVIRCARIEVDLYPVEHALCCLGILVLSYNISIEYQCID